MANRVMGHFPIRHSPLAIRSLPPLALSGHAVKARSIRPLRPRKPREPMPAVQVCATADVPENSVISREVGDELVAIYNINGTY